MDNSWEQMQLQDQWETFVTQWIREDSSIIDKESFIQDFVEIRSRIDKLVRKIINTSNQYIDTQRERMCDFSEAAVYQEVAYRLIHSDYKVEKQINPPWKEVADLLEPFGYHVVFVDGDNPVWIARLEKENE